MTEGASLRVGALLRVEDVAWRIDRLKVTRTADGLDAHLCARKIALAPDGDLARDWREAPNVAVGHALPLSGTALTVTALVLETGVSTEGEPTYLLCLDLADPLLAQQRREDTLNHRVAARNLPRVMEKSEKALDEGAA